MDGSHVGLQETEARSLLERVCEDFTDEDVRRLQTAAQRSSGDVVGALLQLLDADNALHEWFREHGFCNIADTHRRTFAHMAYKGRSIEKIIMHFMMNSHSLRVGPGEYRRSLK